MTSLEMGLELGKLSNEKGPDAEFHHCFTEVFHEPSQTWISLDPHQATKSWAKDEIWEVENGSP